MRRMLIASSVVLVAAGCGGSPQASLGSINQDAAVHLQSDVLALTRAAAAHDWATARTALAALRADVSASRDAGTVGSQRAAAIEAAAAKVAADIPPAVTAVPTPTATPTPKKTSTAPAPAPKPGDHHHGHGDG
ncbi:MAG: hypothetical protein QOG80_99 [Pseudonocardiales bacterium]|nr:hypothetical protein [Pseudonocardiales bacterium]